jgi:predicted amidohydrolase YtcJ
MSEEVARYADADTTVVGVGGATVIPGLIDNHFHFMRAVERWNRTRALAVEYKQLDLEGRIWRRG